MNTLIDAWPAFTSGGSSLARTSSVRIGEDHVERVVDHGAALGEAVVVLDHLGQTHPDMLGREGNDRGRAAERGRGRRGLERVGVHHARGGKLLDMGVRVDAARHHQLAARIDRARARAEVPTDRRDGLAANADVGAHGVGRRHHGAAADHEVEGLHE